MWVLENFTCVCVVVWFTGNYFFLIILVYIYICTFVYIYIYIYIYVCVCVCVFSAWYFRQRTCLGQGLVDGIFNKTWNYLCSQFEWFLFKIFFYLLIVFFYECWSLLFLRVCFTQPTLSHIDFWCLTFCVCLSECVCVRVVSDSTHIFSLCVCVNVCLKIFVCIYIYIYMYVYFHLLVCTIYGLFNFGLNLSIKFFSFIWNSVLSFVWYIGIILDLLRLHWYRCFETFNFLFSSILI